MESSHYNHDSRVQFNRCSNNCIEIGYMNEKIDEPAFNLVSGYLGHCELVYKKRQR